MKWHLVWLLAMWHNTADISGIYIVLTINSPIDQCYILVLMFFCFFFSWRLRWTIIRLDCEWFFWLDFHDAFVGSWQYIRRSYYLLKVYLQINKWKIISIFRTSVLDNYQMQRMDELKKRGILLLPKYIDEVTIECLLRFSVKLLILPFILISTYNQIPY